jgi:hypothetical protein
VTGLSAGKVYRFNYYAKNQFGESTASQILTIAATSLPNSPTNIVVDWTKSTKKSLMLQWSAPLIDSEYPISGYQLEMDDGFGG